MVVEDKRISAALDQITDWYIDEKDPLAGFFYPKSQAIKSHPFLYDFAAELLKQCQKKIKNHDYDEFVVRVGGKSYRGHKIETIEGNFFSLRKMPKTIPSLKTLGLDPAIQTILLSDHLNKGGLVIICGETGQGKSTTCAASIKERMLQFGSFCLTVEDPPEMPLHGQHGQGRCLQTEVKSGSFGDAMRGAVRAQPVANGSILYVGETRDAETAAEVLRIALNGNLVFTTLHAHDIPTALNRLTSLASHRLKDDAQEILANVFRLGLHQVLEPVKPRPGHPPRKRLEVDFLVSKDAKTAVANKIRKKDVQSLGTDLQQQLRLLRNRGSQALIQMWD